MASKLKTDILAPLATPTNEIDVQSLYSWMKSTWHDVGASRAAATTYTNSNAYPIEVAVAVTGTGAYVYGEVDSLTVVVSDMLDNGTYTVHATFSVPPGSTYLVNKGVSDSFQFWLEKY